MNYNQAMRWGRRHPKGTRQPVIMSTGSGFWPARGWLEKDYWPYVDACHKAEVEPLKAEDFYYKTIGCRVFQRTPDDYAAMTKDGTL